jgi:hypothetical protein
MPNAFPAIIRKIQRLIDGPGVLGSGDNGKALTWNNATGRFEMTAVARLPVANTFTKQQLVTPDSATPGLIVRSNNLSQTEKIAEFGGSDGSVYVSFGSTPNSTVGRGYIIVSNPTTDGNGAGFSFSANGKTGVFQLDGSGNMVFRQSQGSMYFDYFSTINFRNGSFANVIAVANDGKVGFSQSGATALVDIAASTVLRAGLRVRNGVRPTANAGNPYDGDIWSVGGHLYWRDGGVDKQLDN